MSEKRSPDATSETAPERPLDLKSWAFWKKRLGRALILGGLALGVAQVLPALPEDQRIEIIAPSGASLSQVQLTYFSSDHDQPLAGTQITTIEPTGRLPHTIRLPNGKYSIQISAHGQEPNGNSRAWRTIRQVSLDGATASVRLAD